MDNIISDVEDIVIENITGGLSDDYFERVIHILTKDKKDKGVLRIRLRSVSKNQLSFGDSDHEVRRLRQLISSAIYTLSN